MDSGAVAWGYALPAVLRAAGPTHFFNSIEEMRSAFQTNFAVDVE